MLANLQKPLLALDAKAGFVGLVILMCWQQIGYMMIIYVAGLQSVPGDLIEAAKIDGASGPVRRLSICSRKPMRRHTL